MKKTYEIGEDLFIIIAFVAFLVGVVLRLLDISPIIWGITTAGLLKGTVVCLLFSIALSVRELARSKS